MGFEDQLLEWMLDIAYKYGYAGAFLASLLGNASILLPAPYALFVFVLGTVLDPLPLAIISGTGAALGELTGYALGAAWRKALTEVRKAKLEKAKKLLERPAFPLIVLMAATPLPDDVVSLPLGLMRYPLWKAFPAFLIGKTILCLFLAYSGKFAVTAVLAAFQVGGIWGVVGTGVAMVVIAAILLLVDWDITLQVVEERGWRGLLSPSFMKRMLLSVGHRFRRSSREEQERDREADVAEGPEGSSEQGLPEAGEG